MIYYVRMGEKFFTSWDEKFLNNGKYNTTRYYSDSFIKALSKKIKYISLDDVFAGSPVNVMCGFNLSGFPCWEALKKTDVLNVIWSTNSVFGKNFDEYKQYSHNSKFFLLTPSPSDRFATEFYLPHFVNCRFFPPAVDLDVWKYKKLKKTNDIVFFASIVDIDKKLDYMSQKYPEDLYKILLYTRDLALDFPNLNFWYVYQSIKEGYGLELEDFAYYEIYKDISELCDSYNKIAMAQALEKFNVKIYGNDVWQKYIKGKLKYCGECDIKDSVKIINKSKISLHNQSMQTLGGLHPRFLNASAVKTFSICRENSSLAQEFGTSFGIFNDKNYEDLPDVVSYYLQVEDEREEKANNCYNIVKEKHTWDNRVDTLLTIIKY